MITLAPSYITTDALLDAYFAAGGAIGYVDINHMVNCAGTPPTFFANWNYRRRDQYPNLYKGVVDMREVVAVQSHGQTLQEECGVTDLDVILNDLKDYEFVGAHAAEWYCRPENKEAFLEVCPTGCLVFLEWYLHEDGYVKVVYVSMRDGVVRVGESGCEATENVFDNSHHFAVRKPKA